MAAYQGYDNLEKKIKQIRNDVDNWCSIVDHLSDARSADCRSVEDNSISSYHTAIWGSDSSLDSFMTALDTFEEGRVEVCDEIVSRSQSVFSRKTVSFSNHVTVLEPLQKDGKTMKTKAKMRNIKNKFLDYIYRERFYLKYKWQKLKRNMRAHHKTREQSTAVTEVNQKNTVTSDAVSKVKEEHQTLFNLQIFFNECIESFVLETDIDDESLSVMYRDCSFRQTDLSSPVVARKLISSADENSVVAVKMNDIPKEKSKPLRRNMVEPRLLKRTCDDTSDGNSFGCDLLYRYLVAKAQYPIQLKIANSIVKLNLPVWYQSCLVA